MVWTARIDVAPLKHVYVVAGIAVAWLTAAILLGAFGPKVLDVEKFSAFDCPRREHINFNNNTCKGIDLATGAWSDVMRIKTDQLNRHWYCQLTLYTNRKYPDGIWQDVLIDTIIQGYDTNSRQWLVLTNKTEKTFVPCPAGGAQCPSFILVFENNIQYVEYSVQTRFSAVNGKNLWQLADVEFSLFEDSRDFSKLALIIRVVYLAFTVAAISYHLLKLRGEQLQFSAWSLEQRLLLVLLLALVFLNNPMYPLEYVVTGWVFVFIDAFLELLFVCMLFLFWYLAVAKMRSTSGGLDFNSWLKVKIVGVGLYAVLTTILYGWISIRDQASPLFGIARHITAIQTLFYVSSILYLFLVLAFFADIFFAWTNLEAQPGLKYQILFFTTPSVVVISSVLIGIILGFVGPFSRETPAFVYFLTMYNVYVMVLLWGYWPVEKTMGGLTNPTESTRIFSDSTHDDRHSKGYATL